MGRQGDRKVWHVALITIVGPLSCAATSAAFNAVAFRELGDAAFAQAMFSAVALPLALGIPLFLYASLKLAELSDVNEKLGIIAATDGLTQCLNHRAFSTLVSLSVQPEAPGESATTGAFLIVDADRFKSINDRFGHNSGDIALTLIARALRNTIRRDDLVGRLGGEEFGVFLPGADLEGAERVAERLRAAVADAGFTVDGDVQDLTVSVGGIVFDTATSFEDLYRAADKRLYRAKQTGRNRVFVSPHPGLSTF